MHSPVLPLEANNWKSVHFGQTAIVTPRQFVRDGRLYDACDFGGRHQTIRDPHRMESRRRGWFVEAS